MKVVALVITYNRKEMLQRSLDRLFAQKQPLERILVFNNASTDGTQEYLESLKHPLLFIHHHPLNIGGAGGYHEGFKMALKWQPDWVWCVEDDILAPRDFIFRANASLQDAKRNKRGFVFPQLRCVYEPRQIQRPQKEEIGPNHTLEKAVFAGCLINSTAIDACGYPIKKYFIYFDDWEYTSRLSRMGYPGLYVPSLHLWHHDAAKPMQKGYLHVAYSQLWKSLYGIRNELSFYKKYKPLLYPKLLVKHIVIIPLQILLYRPDHKWKAAIRWAHWSLKSLFF